ncbi:hypothetical protein B1B04_19985, partial [Lysinibacillus sp. KCTC 33748]
MLEYIFNFLYRRKLWYIMPAFEKCYKKFDYYDINEIDIETWKLIIWELEKMKQYLSDNPNPHSL